ncbi:phospho-sugar mutase [Fodinicola acaciae]|uniref:phospho-sugar mutase n=1 Tax=Fodinicola acaciae TaxID=2681555 RepID=UPI0013D8AFDA|nr:phospho-sugar mutase [Fodinicola acaciae]
MAQHDDLTAAATAWRDDDPDPATRAELQALIDGLPRTAAELKDRFAQPLAFGTAGLRGVLRAGPNGMNRAVVRAAAAGLSSYLDSAGRTGPVVIGFDARHGSRDFAEETAAVVTGSGREALLMPKLLPTPLLAYAVRALDATAGVMVTASHNPPADNGYKVYLGGADGRGGQIVPPVDRGIEAAIRAVGPLADVRLGHGWRIIDESLVESYVDAVAALVDADAPKDLRVAYTAMHGVGAETLARVFAKAGFRPPDSVPEQHDPDPDFPTVPFPNPEEPGAMDLVRALAAKTGADIAIANDPDADRCAVAVADPARGPASDPDSWRILRGDEVGVLLADHLIRLGRTGTYATTIVSSQMLRSIAEKAGQPYAETLTGFKWIVRAGEPLAYGYEEALGYCVAPDLVRDKDGISAAILIADLAARLKAAGATLLDRLDELARVHGRHQTDQLSVRVTDVAEIAAAMARLRAHPPAALLGRPVTGNVDLLPDADVVTLRADGVRVVVRPSGTEPKLKAYLETVELTGDAMTRLRGEIGTALGL